MMKYHFILHLFLIIFVVACVASPQNSRTITDDTQKVVDKNPGSGGGQGTAYNSGGTTINNGQTTSIRVDLMQIIDPFDGVPKAKVSIPANFTGPLYISGINVSTLRNRIVNVRFKFGKEKNTITIPATVAKASGITPDTDMQVLILNIKNRPFEDVLLSYQLFDYNDYGASDDPVIDPRDKGLYCRGLKAEDDPTFTPTPQSATCSFSDAECLYSYASIADSGLMYTSSINPAVKVATIPSLAQIASLPLYSNSSESDILKRCLPDSNSIGSLRAILNQSAAAIPGPLGWNYEILFSGTSYFYQGPFYSPVPVSYWEITGDAIFKSKKGIFEYRWDNAGTNSEKVKKGYGSYLFPRAGKMSLRQNVQYFGADTPFGAKTLQTMSSNGDSKYMDGCNFRMLNPEISSCNVTATIEVVEINPLTLSESIITSSKDLKLQLIRPSIENSEGQEVLYSAVKKCSSKNDCGSEECCFNERCWAKSVVGQCLEDAVNVGNIGPGGSCSSDYECASLCCNQSLGVCNNHINNDIDQILCSKAPGETCVAQEWCKQEYVSECKNYRIGVDVAGNEVCEVRCFPVLAFGSCRNGLCISPKATAAPTIDPNNRCQGAVDLP